MNETIMSRIKDKLSQLPLTSGVYLMKDIDGNIIYVGKAKNLKRRVSSYFLNTTKTIKTSKLVENIYDFDYLLTPSEFDALALECNLIKKYMPYYNILLKDGKHMPYIRIDLKKDYPNIEIVRKIKNDNAKYFGPYFQGVRAGELLKIIYTAFPLRQCKLNLSKVQKRECLNFHLGLCSAPCTRQISSTEYHELIKQVMNFLNGNDKEVEKILTEKMQRASQNQQFENAIIFRNQLKMVEKLRERVIMQLPRNIDIDIFAFASNGEYGAQAVAVVRGGKMIGVEINTVFNVAPTKSELLLSFISQYYSSNNLVPNLVIVPNDFDEMELLTQFVESKNPNAKIEKPQIGAKAKLLEATYNNALEHLEKQIDQEKFKRSFTLGACELLKRELNLERLPLRIEAFDISNISGTNKVSSMVVFVNGEPKKSHYRKFIIKTVEGANDFASMAETLSRRFAEYKKGTDESFSYLPDLILIDGGKGQLSYAFDEMQKANIKTQMISLAEKEEIIFKPFQSQGIVLERSNFALRLLQRVRNESHRFAITFHRNKREKIKSLLENISGIGTKRAKILLKTFQSIDEISKATVEQLSQVDGIGEKYAKTIYEYFNHKQ